MTVPPQPPVPVLKDTKHHIIELEWGEYLERVADVFSREDGKISVELQYKQKVNNDWELIYAGYAGSSGATNLEPETLYQFRMRFRNKHGPGPFSSLLEVTTTKRPLTGEDIHKAIRMEDIYALRKILSTKEANIEAQDDLGFTPLQAAANRDASPICETLLEFGADLETESDASKTALMIAAFKSHTNVMERLIEAGANIEHQDKNGLTALHIAVDGEKTDAVELLLRSKANPNCVDHKLRWTPLHRCAGLKNNGNDRVASMLIRFKVGINLCDRDGKTALMLAATNGHHKLVEVLLDNGADLTMVNEMGHNAWTLAEANDRRVVKRVIQDFMSRTQMKLESLNYQERLKRYQERRVAQPTLDVT